jgi:hypothetical protein
MVYGLGESTIDDDPSYSHAEQHDQPLCPFDAEL